LEESQALQILESIHRCLVEERPVNYEECVRWARLQWDKLNQNPIKQLLIHFPPNQLLKTGKIS
jgi:ubiquitin-activating enzyme E1